MRTAPTALIAWLENNCPIGNDIRCDELGYLLVKGGKKFIDGRSLLQSIECLPEVLIGGAQNRKPWRTRWVNWTLWRTRAAALGGFTVILAHSLDAKPDFVDQLLGAYLLSLPLALILVAAAWQTAGMESPAPSRRSMSRSVRFMMIRWRGDASLVLQRPV